MEDIEKPQKQQAATLSPVAASLNSVIRRRLS
jgi:hypothetical protein